MSARRGRHALPGLIVGAQPADEPALFFRRPRVVESDEMGEKLLFERCGIFQRGTGSLPVCTEEITGGLPVPPLKR